MCMFRSLIVSALGIVSHASTMLRLSRLSPGVVPEESTIVGILQSCFLFCFLLLLLLFIEELAAC